MWYTWNTKTFYLILLIFAKTQMQPLRWCHDDAIIKTNLERERGLLLGCYNSPPLEGIAPRDSKRKERKSRDTRIEDDLRVQIMRLLQKFCKVVWRYEIAWFKVDEKFNSSVRWHTWELLRENIKKVADHWNNLIGWRGSTFGVKRWT